jgi:hypothetical protein
MNSKTKALLILRINSESESLQRRVRMGILSLAHHLAHGRCSTGACDIDCCATELDENHQESKSLSSPLAPPSLSRQSQTSIMAALLCLPGSGITHIQGTGDKSLHSLHTEWSGPEIGHRGLGECLGPFLWGKFISACSYEQSYHPSSSEVA